MISHELKLVTTNVFRRLGTTLGIIAAWIIGIMLIGATFELVIDHKFDSYLISLQGIPGTLPAFFNIGLIAYFLIDSYSDFKWAIQNGISRKTLWNGRLIAAIVATVGIWIVDELLTLFNHPITSWASMGVNLLLLLTAALTAQMIGNGFGLLNRTWKWIVGIGLPVAFILLLVGIARVLVSLGGFQYNFWFGPDSPLVNMLNSEITWWIFWGIYIVIVLLISKFFSDRMQLRRD
ncbi:hypothetical protein AALA17_07410 [Lactobacillaceae bacterium 24-114]